MIYEKVVTNGYGNLVSGATVDVYLDGALTDIGPLVSNDLGVASFDAPEGDYEVKLAAGLNYA